jgi:polyisoprenoid-binding protein YceI
VTEPALEPPSGGPPSGFPRWLTWSLLGALAVLLLGYGAIFLYAKVINDGPAAFDGSDLDAALAVGEPADETEQTLTTDPPRAVAPTDSIASSDGTEPQGDAGGAQVWAISDESQVGYRVKEILFGVDTEGVGRTNQLSGSFVIDGTRVVSGEFVVDVASIASDDGRRDNQFRGRIMSTDEFPEAAFTLTEPIELGTEPADGVEVATTATGELTLRGVTNSVTFDVAAEQQSGRIGVLGAIPIAFADYSIANPSFGGITTEDEGLLEFVLVFEPA